MNHDDDSEMLNFQYKQLKDIESSSSTSSMRDDNCLTQIPYIYVISKICNIHWMLMCSAKKFFLRIYRKFGYKKKIFRFRKAQKVLVFRCFCQQFGSTFYSFIRINRACSLLSSNNLLLSGHEDGNCLNTISIRHISLTLSVVLEPSQRQYLKKNKKKYFWS